MTNENSGNAVRNRTSSASIHSGAPGRGRHTDRPAIASHAASPADIGYASSRTCPEPLQSRHDCLTASAAARIKVPITKVRRERRNFHPCPRHDGQAIPAPPVVPMTIRLPIRVAAPISARYTETGYKLAISHAAPTYGNCGRRKKQRHAWPRRRPDPDPGLVLGATRGCCGPAPPGHRPVLRPRAAVHRSQPDPDRHCLRAASGQGQRHHPRHPAGREAGGVRPHRRWPRAARPRPDRPRSGPAPPADAEALAPVLTGHSVDPAALEVAPDIRALATAANDARRQYQACRYSDLIPHLSVLLSRLGAACQLLDGDDQLRAFTLSADAHHVAAGLLLKLDDRGLAAVAADRSMRAALASQDPMTVGASARILTHTLMNGGHLAAAVTTASSQAQKLDHDTAVHTPESLSVYGSLLLRGAVAAAQRDQRDTAYQLLTEADDAAHRLDLRAIPVTQRKASLLIDTARAFLQWGRHEKAYIALRAAEEVAPEEVTGRPSVHRLLRDLITIAPPRRRAVRHPDRHHPVTQDTHGRVLSVIACGAGPATAIGTFVQLAQERSWRVQVIATPAALGFFDQAAIEKQTGSPVRSQYSKPGSPRSQIPDAIIVAPATYNTINKWALGISDTYALGVLAETTALDVPIVVLPFVNTALASRDPFRRRAGPRWGRPGRWSR